MEGKSPLASNLGNVMLALREDHGLARSLRLQRNELHRDADEAAVQGR